MTRTAALGYQVQTFAHCSHTENTTRYDAAQARVAGHPKTTGRETVLTTNVRDEIAGELATDSRWSIDLRRHGKPLVIYQDDAEYQKLIEIKNSIFMFAGNSKFIDVWKGALCIAAHFPKVVHWRELPTTGMSFCRVALDSGVVEEFGKISKVAGASFTGTGALYAKEAWLRDGNAQQAVRSAMARDPLTGGAVRYYNWKTGVKDLGLDKSFSNLQNGFRTKGIVMNTESMHLVPVAQAAANDNSLHDVLNKISSGDLAASAPCGDEDFEWTDEEAERLALSMEKLFSGE